MNKLLFLIFSSFLLNACVATVPVVAESDEEIAKRRLAVLQLEDGNYRRERKIRQDAIDDLGTMQMNTAKAINKANENRSKQRNIYIIR
ncbi:aerial mycelium formation protein [Neisseria animalis]|uniref:Aerial mycelium formation protein n=1 Tax=Neisseria animalis TaxID=492 RepID=A0A5P3MTW5_NEIAN|nr:aerial mycelium formation protein [Neisseria animalis]QEY24505.1 aerial mycelium formation protein [Neisseria animalis]ROW33076.1 aerial mycelium formation protein [Neisseria animalis]VEE07216.1 Uncharacterised protein [Neisseria animalis]